MYDAEFKRVIQDLLALADQTQADIDSLDQMNTVADLTNAGLVLIDIEEHLEALSYYITANQIVKKKLEILSKKIVEKQLDTGITIH
jgi:hypothetical protein|tara:strand:- start:1657 stop:1917 length:261 start_codon:yes stop_codon:yes gene_type:complete